MQKRWLIIGFISRSGMAFPPCGGGAKMFGVCPCKRGIAAEARSEAAFCCGYALPDQIFGMDQTTFLEISVDGSPSFLSEQTHHMVFADVKLICQCIDIDIFCQVSIDIAQDI